MQIKAKMTIPLISLADDIQQLTYDLVRYNAICDRVCVNELGVTASQGYIILALPEAGSLTMNDLSVKMKLANSTMTRMADQLIQKKMITRESDLDDRRVVRVRLTEQGQAVKTHLKQTMQDLFSQILADIPADEQEQVIRSLKTLKQAILNTLKSCCEVDLTE
jgi:DNA-binding MarR family transcriptional regulator